MRQVIYNFLIKYFWDILLRVAVAVSFGFALMLWGEGGIGFNLVSIIFALIGTLLMDAWKWFCNKIEGKK